MIGEDTIGVVFEEDGGQPLTACPLDGAEATKTGPPEDPACGLTCGCPADVGFGEDEQDGEVLRDEEEEPSSSEAGSLLLLLLPESLRRLLLVLIICLPLLAVPPFMVGFLRWGELVS